MADETGERTVPVRCKSCRRDFVGYPHCLALCLRCSHIQLKNAEGTLATLDAEADGA